MAIENVLSNQVPPDLIKVLQDQQTVVDQDQQPTNSFEHSMTGLAQAGETTNIETPIYILETETFVHTNLALAIQDRKAGDTNDAFICLGKAMHPLEDATSPSHKPFQAWKYNEGLWEEIVHVFHERSYPDSPERHQPGRRTGRVGRRRSICLRYFHGKNQHAGAIFQSHE